MSNIAPHRTWYIAEIVMQIYVEGETDTLIHLNTHLISAESPDQAFNRAEQIGHDGEIKYENTDHKGVQIRYRGVHDLFLIHDELGDGAELLYEERSGMNESEIAALVSPKSDMSIFQAKTG